jgi:hypothetical protein
MTDTAYNGKPDGGTGGARSVYLALYFLGAVLSGAGGNYLWMRNIAPDVVVPDRFTATQARALEHEMEQLEAQIMFHVREHPDRVNQFDRRIAVLETQYSTMISTLRRIEEKIDRAVK